MSAIKPQAAFPIVGRAETWFVGYTKPREERRALENLQRQGFDCHLPTIRVQRRARGAIRWEAQPLFPRYLFLRPGPKAAPLERVRSTFGMAGLVRFAGLPATVAHAVVQELAKLGERVREVFFSPGEAVCLAEGPLAGLEGVFERLDGEERAVVLLEFMARQRRVVVPASQLVATA